MTAAYGAEVDHLRYAWGETPDPDDVRARLREREAKAVWVVHSETSTGVVTDIQALAAAAKEAGALVVVDAVSSLGAVPCETDAWGLDVVVSGSQKALMTPPGLGLCAVSEAALAATGTPPRFYFDWERTRKAQAKLDAAFTPPVSLVAGARRRARAAARGRARGGVRPARPPRPRLRAPARRRWGSSSSRPTRTAAPSSPRCATPDGINSDDVVKGLRDRFGMTIANGQGELKGKIFRLGHIGWFDVFDITTHARRGRARARRPRRGDRARRRVTAALEAYEHAPVA